MQPAFGRSRRSPMRRPTVSHVWPFIDSREIDDVLIRYGQRTLCRHQYEHVRSWASSVSVSPSIRYRQCIAIALRSSLIGSRRVISIT